MKTLTLDGNSLSIEDVVNVARNHQRVKLATKSVNAIKLSRKAVDDLVKEDKVVYGLTTGFGSLANVKIDKKNTVALQKNLIRSHAAGVGEPLKEDVVRAIMLLRLNTFAKGCSGIRLETVNTLLSMLNRDIYAFIPEQGSVGSSGDLAPLSHLFLVLMGEGEALVNGKRVSGASVMKKAKIKPVNLTSKEGLALNNGTPVMTAIGALLTYDAEKLVNNSHVTAAMTMEALLANSRFLDEKVHNVRPHPQQKASAALFRKLLKGSKLIDGNKTKVQDSYSIRASPVVLGASWDAIKYVKEKITIEINSATDNPLIFGKEAYSAANFHGQPMALAMDFLKIALCEIGDIAERRIAKIVDPHNNEGLPAMLVAKSGVNNGFMIPQYTAAALVSENKVLAHPASVDSIPTCANQEDHVSMGTIAARQAAQIFRNVEHVIAIELLVAGQALDFRDVFPAPALKVVLTRLRKTVPFMKQDCVMYPMMERAVALVREGL